MRSAWAAIAVAAALAMAGCLSSSSDLQEQFSLGDGGDDDVVRTGSERLSYEASEPGVNAGWTTAQAWSLTLPGELLGASLDVETGEAANDWRVQAATPSGETVTVHVPPGEATASTNLSEPEAGSYEIEVQTQGPRAPDDVTVDVSYTWRGEAGGASDVEDTSGVRFERTSDGQWKAYVTHRASSQAGERVDLEADTFNGEVRLATEGDETRATVTAYGRADTKERARQLATDVEVTLEASAATVVARASTGTEQTRDDEGQGAHVEVRTPARVGGTAGTANGPIDLRSLEAGRLEASTSNGPVRGTVADAAGDLTLSTSNGPIDVDVTPSRSLRLDVDTSNGPVDLGLTEGDPIGYELEASTSNGEITEDMEEADLEERDAGTGDAVLRTEGYSSRSIQVDGPVGTSNGGIHFQGR